jgi:hypothetical protein
VRHDALVFHGTSISWHFAVDANTEDDGTERRVSKLTSKLTAYHCDLYGRRGHSPVSWTCFFFAARPCASVHGRGQFINVLLC